jgi:hypothetical protein
MYSETPLAFHRRRIEALSNTLAAWMVCGSVSCRRKGRCRRGDEVLPACVLPILRGVHASIGACLAEIPDAAPRPEPQEESLRAQTARIARRVGNLLEAQLDDMERRQERRAGG